MHHAFNPAPGFATQHRVKRHEIEIDLHSYMTTLCDQSLNNCSSCLV